MRKEIRRIIRQIGQSEQCPLCEIDAESIREEFMWNGAVRHLQCPECGCKFRIEFRITGNKFQTQVVLPRETRTMNVDLTHEEEDYLRRAFTALKPR